MTYRELDIYGVFHSMIRYYRLWTLLSRRNMKKTDLLEVISPPTLAKLSKGATVTTDVIDRLCKYLNVQPGDIMEYEEFLESEKMDSTSSSTRS